MEENVFGVTPEAAASAGDEPAPAARAASNDASIDADHDAEMGDEPAKTDPPADPGDEPAPSPDAAQDPPSKDRSEELFTPEDGDSVVQIGEKAYRSPEAAGRAYKALSARARDAHEARRAAEAEAARLRALVEARVAEPTPATPDPAPAPPAAPATGRKRLTDLISRDEIDNLIASEEGPAAAFKKLGDLVDERLEQVYAEIQGVKPVVDRVRPIVERDDVVVAADKLFTQVQGLKDEAGEALFPELQDPNSPEVAAITEIWRRQLDDPEARKFALTPHGVRYAIVEYRSQRPTSTAPPEPRTDPGRSTAAARKASAALQSMGSATSARPGGTAGPARSAEETYAESIRARQHPLFGVAVGR